MESGSELEEVGRSLLRQRLWQLATKGELGRTVKEYHEYQKLLALWHEDKI